MPKQILKRQKRKEKKKEWTNKGNEICIPWQEEAENEIFLATSICRSNVTDGASTEHQAPPWLFVCVNLELILQNLSWSYLCLQNWRINGVGSYSRVEQEHQSLMSIQIEHEGPWDTLAEGLVLQGNGKSSNYEKNLMLDQE